ncbi:MAG: hypothetical protein HC783_00665 [Rhodobacteraceae bacterium]|nr:hypothetical protein [Paracoccaceae bacterium]
MVFGLFCLASFWIWLPPASNSAPANEDGPQDLVTRMAAYEAEIAALIPVTGDRPLFQADRRPIAAPEAPAPPPEAVLVLVGILGDGDERIALVRRSTSEDLFQIEAGGQLGQWTILSVDISSISVSEADGSTFTLRLDG